MTKPDVREEWRVIARQQAPHLSLRGIEEMSDWWLERCIPKEEIRKAVQELKRPLWDDHAERRLENVARYNTLEEVLVLLSSLEEKKGCQCNECKISPHYSDCAVHNEPAERNGKCTCGRLK